MQHHQHLKGRKLHGSCTTPAVRSLGGRLSGALGWNSAASRQCSGPHRCGWDRGSLDCCCSSCSLQPLPTAVPIWPTHARLTRCWRLGGGGVRGGGCLQRAHLAPRPNRLFSWWARPRSCACLHRSRLCSCCLKRPPSLCLLSQLRPKGAARRQRGKVQGASVSVALIAQGLQQTSRSDMDSRVGGWR